MGRFQLELIYLYFPLSSHLDGTNGTTVEKKGKLILTSIFMYSVIWNYIVFKENYVYLLIIAENTVSEQIVHMPMKVFIHCK